MKIVDVRPKVDMELCRGCKTCELVCPVYAVKVSRKDKEIRIDLDEKLCVGCWNCEQRCPDHAIAMEPCTPRTLTTDVSQFDYEEIKELCRKARFHPKQAVCYCTASRAEEIAAAILAGAKSPDAIVLATGVGAGCGIECNQPILRFLEAAGCTYERPKNSYQWYGRTCTIWDVPEAVRKSYPVFRFEGDQDLFERVINAPVRS